MFRTVLTLQRQCVERGIVASYSQIQFPCGLHHTASLGAEASSSSGPNRWTILCAGTAVAGAILSLPNSRRQTVRAETWGTPLDRKKAEENEMKVLDLELENQEQAWKISDLQAQIDDLTRAHVAPKLKASRSSIVQVEELRFENNFVVNAQGILRKASERKPTKTMLGELPDGGKYDAMLLTPGRSQELLRTLAEIFDRDGSLAVSNRYATEVFSASAVAKMIEMAHYFWADMPNVDRLPVPSRGRTILVGDTHGQLEDVLWMFFKYGVPSASNQYLFLGDLVDRGCYGLEILLLLFALKRDDCNCVHIIRGNHEDKLMAEEYGFQTELESKFGDRDGQFIRDQMCERIFAHLPICAIMSRKEKFHKPICAMHGGVPVRAKGQDQVAQVSGVISQLNRNVTTVLRTQTTEQEILFNMLWADPVGRSSSYSENQGRGNPFQESDTFDFCEANGLYCIVRAHEPPKDGRGFWYHHSNKCVTVFSASNYMGALGNKGGVLICSREKKKKSSTGGTKPEHGVFEASEFWAPPLRHIVRTLKEHDILTADRDVRMQVAEAAEHEYADEQEAATAHLKDLEKFAMKQICMHKEELFKSFFNWDLQHKGTVPHELFLEVMAQILPEVPPVWAELSKIWDLSENVNYVHFLYRFRIRDATMHPRMSLPDVEDKVLLEALKTSWSQAHTITLEDFKKLLVSWDLDMPLWQAAVWFHAIVKCFGGVHELVIEDIILAVMLSTGHSTFRAVRSVSPEWYESALVVISEGIVNNGQNVVQFYLDLDKERRGYVTFEQFKQAIASFPNMPIISDLKHEQIEALARHIDDQGMQEGKVHFTSFCRALVPSRFWKQMLGEWMKEVLHPIYKHRQSLAAALSKMDPMERLVVSVEQFQDALHELNKREVWTPLPELHVKAICDIAAGSSRAASELESIGERRVLYSKWLSSLKVSDLEADSRTGEDAPDQVAN